MRLYGRRSIIERIKSNPKSVRKVYLQEGLDRRDITNFAHKNNIFTEIIGINKFNQLAQKNQAQGVIADVEGFEYSDFEDIINREDTDKPTLIFLDRINDPQNLGVILRNCACLGGFCIVFPRHESVEVTEAVIKVACGAENYVPVCMVTNLSIAIQKARQLGYWLGATVVEDGMHPRLVNFNFPLCVIFGSEGKGIRPGLLKDIDYKLTLPMQGARLSFNVAMAVGMLCYEINCQKNHPASTDNPTNRKG